MRVFSPSPTPFKFRGTPSFPFTLSSHGCESVNGKLGGAGSDARKRGGQGHKRAEWRAATIRIRPTFRPGSGPEVCPIGGRILGRICGPIGGPFRAIPQSIAGRLSASQDATEGEGFRKVRPSAALAEVVPRQGVCERARHAIRVGPPAFLLGVVTGSSTGTSWGVPLSSAR